MNKLQKGFTLIELLVVISIISLLSSIVLTSVDTARERARTAFTAASVRTYITALESFYIINGYYPGDSSGTSPFCLGETPDTETGCWTQLYGGTQSALNQIIPLGLPSGFPLRKE